MITLILATTLLLPLDGGGGTGSGLTIAFADSEVLTTDGTVAFNIPSTDSYGDVSLGVGFIEAKATDLVLSSGYSGSVSVNIYNDTGSSKTYSPTIGVRCLGAHPASFGSAMSSTSLGASVSDGGQSYDKSGAYLPDSFVLLPNQSRTFSGTVSGQASGE